MNPWNIAFKLLFLLVMVIMLAAAGCEPGLGQKTQPMHNRQDLAEILQAVLDAEQLQQYYHVDELPERKPVRIAERPELEPHPEVVKFNTPAVYQAREELERKNLPYFTFPRIVINQDLAYLAFRYDVEGLRGSAFLVRSNDGWRLEHLTLSEEDKPY